MKEDKKTFEWGQKVQHEELGTVLYLIPWMDGIQARIATCDGVTQFAFTDSLSPLPVEALTIPEPPEWMTLFNAPRDGTEVLLWHEANPGLQPGRADVGRWVASKMVEGREGWWACNCVEVPAVLWMPIPPARPIKKAPETPVEIKVGSRWKWVSLSKDEVVVVSVDGPVVRYRYCDTGQECQYDKEKFLLYLTPISEDSSEPSVVSEPTVEERLARLEADMKKLILWIHGGVPEQQEVTNHE